MITISRIKKASGAAKYYTKEDNYYLAEADAKEASLWWGKGAIRLGVCGKVEEKELQKLLEGKLANGTVIGLQKDGTIIHRPGYDICFHPPKSVSILALDGEDDGFYNAHLDAVRTTLKFIERDCAQAKVFKDGQIKFERTQNLAVALIRHTMSRKRDLHLHHHAIVINATQKQDGTWRALASHKVKNQDHPNGFSERVYHNQIYYGLIYKATLANKVRELGYEIEVVGKHGLWEIKGVPQAAIDVMSKRSLEIEKRAAKLNYPSLKATDVIALDTREKKPKGIKLSEIKQNCRDQLAAVGFSSKEFIADFNKSKDRNNDYAKETKTDSSTTARQAIEDAVSHLSQYSLKLDYAKIVTQALEFSIVNNSHEKIVNALNEAIKSGALIPLDDARATFVTKELIETEKNLMDLVARSKTNNAINSKYAASINLKDSVIDHIPNGKIKELAVGVLQSNNRLSLIEHRLVDNTELYSAFLSLAESSGKTVRMLSPNRMLANDINENLKRKPSTLWQWLVSLGKPEVGESVAGFKYKYQEEIDLPLLRFRQGKDVIIVNSAQTLGSSDTKALLELAEQTNANLIFLKDLSEKQGVHAGNSMTTLKHAGIKTFKINNKNIENHKLGCIPELQAIKDNDERIKQLAFVYASKEEQVRNNTLVFVGNKKQLSSTNEVIREELKSQGKLSDFSDTEHAISVLNPVYLSKPEKSLAHRYHQNMVIRFYEDNHSYQDWNIERIDKEKNILRLSHGKKRISFNPKESKEDHTLFQKEYLQIAKGDKLIATYNMNDLGIKNAALLTVQEINEKHVELSASSKVIKLRLNILKDSHLQYNYATTLSKHSKKADHILADIKSYALDKPTIKELTGRTQKSLTIFTDNLAIAQKRFGVTPVKLTAVETLLEESSAIGGRVDRLINDKTVVEIKADVEKAITCLNKTKSPPTKAVDFALEKLISHRATFTHKELVVEALGFSLQEQLPSPNETITHDDIMQVIAEKRASGELVMGRYFDDGTRWTTSKILDLERSIINDLKKGQDKLEPLLDHKAVTSLTGKTNLTQNQKNACHLITTTKDQFVIVQGYAGTGKTTMFSHIQNILKESNEKDRKNEKNQSSEESGKNRTQEASVFNDIKKATTNREASLLSSDIHKPTIEMLALAPTHRAVKELKSIGVEAQTLKSFLVEEQRDASILTTKSPMDLVNIDKELNDKSFDNKLNNKLIVLDEASMVSNKDMHEFLNIVKDSNNHVIFSGDIAQHISIESGKPFEMVQKSNILKTVYLREIIRQKNPRLKEAVASVINKDYKTAFTQIENEDPQKHITRIKSYQIENTSGKDIPNSQNNKSFDFLNNLNKSIVEIDNNKLQKGEATLEEMVAEDFLSRIPQVQEQTVVIVHANHDRKVIADLIRTGLKEQGIIGSKGIEMNCLTPKGLTDIEHKYLHSYQVGDAVKLGKEYHKVLKSDPITKSISLKNEAGKTKYFYPEKYIDKSNLELYEHTKTELAIGDTIRLTKTDKENERYANFEYRVKKVSANKIVLESKDGSANKEVILNPKELKDAHWDYAQTVTGYGIQGGSKPYAIDFEVSYHKNLANQRSFYIGISRAIKHLLIYTDNKVKLLKRIFANKGDKYAALEIVDNGITNNDRGYDNDVIGISKTKNIGTGTGTGTVDKSNSDFYDVKEIEQLLDNSAEAFVERLLGPPNKKLSSATEWRYGNKGGLAIKMGGDQKGLWHNFETNESGNLLTLLQKETGLSFRESLKYVANMFGQAYWKNSPKEHQTDALVNPKNPNSKTYTKEHQPETKTARYAKQLASESLPIVGTIVEKYLKKRGIGNTISPNIRYHPKVYSGKNEKQKYLPAMIAIGRDKDGKVQCAQATYLDPSTSSKANLDTKKRTYASSAGIAVLLPRSSIGSNDTNKQITFIAEGVETGLSVRDATKSNVLVTLGKSNFVNIDPQGVGHKVVFCLDNDGGNSFVDGIIHKAAERLVAHGKEVLISMPRQINNGKNTKIDFNDLACLKGINEVRKKHRYCYFV